ncbi:MBL fold metallo-hydrolase [Flavihumibacter solisilvae]|uniref:Beta-lactamase n=1 Tax=Flavihumibacter solisilvae TaxID=1349421 RepID=A0A0C1KYT4_9BACT|nr:MBL fold metallo-hydrolase [Flavihumibacter solisilvae]KIC92862.1 beta-lactamase [Flavihumibacter solisilvae]
MKRPSSLTITFLGTGTSSGVPMIGCSCEVCTSTDKRDNRLRSSILVRSATTTLVVDSTPDFRYQMLRAQVKKLDGIVFTHPHKDHIAGLDDVRAYNFFSKQPMHIYANEMTQMAIIREFPYAFAETRYPGVPDIQINAIDMDPFTVGDIEVVPILVWHMMMPVLGFRFGDFTYITDANRIDEPEIQKIRGSSHLVLNALRHEKHISHFTLGEAVEMVQTIGVPNAYFTHISHQLGLHELVNASLPPGMQLAYDGLTVTVPC